MSFKVHRYLHYPPDSQDENESAVKFTTDVTMYNQEELLPWTHVVLPLSMIRTVAYIRRTVGLVIVQAN